MVFLECHQPAYWLSTGFPEFRYLNAKRLQWWSNSVITCQNMNSWGLSNSFITRKHCGCSGNPYHSLWGLVLRDIINPSLVTDALYHHNVLNQPSLVSSDLWWWSLNIPGVFVHEDIYLPRYLLFMPSVFIFYICWTMHIFKHYTISIALNICTILNNVDLTKGNFPTFKHRF